MELRPLTFKMTILVSLASGLVSSTAGVAYAQEVVITEVKNPPGTPDTSGIDATLAIINPNNLPWENLSNPGDGENVLVFDNGNGTTTTYVVGEDGELLDAFTMNSEGKVIAALGIAGASEGSGEVGSTTGEPASSAGEVGGASSDATGGESTPSEPSIGWTERSYDNGDGTSTVEVTVIQGYWDTTTYYETYDDEGNLIAVDVQQNDGPVERAYGPGDIQEEQEDGGEE